MSDMFLTTAGVVPGIRWDSLKQIFISKKIFKIENASSNGS